MAAKCVERNIDVIKKSTPMSTKAHNKAHCAQTCAGPEMGSFLPIRLLSMCSGEDPFHNINK